MDRCWGAEVFLTVLILCGQALARSTARRNNGKVPKRLLGPPPGRHIEVDGPQVRFHRQLTLHTLDRPVREHQRPRLAFQEQSMDVLAKWPHNPHVSDPGHVEISQCYVEREMEVIGVHGAILPAGSGLKPSCQSRQLAATGPVSHPWSNRSYGLFLDRT
jgi:hypothetical protein